MNGKISRVVLFKRKKGYSTAVATSQASNARISHVYILIALPQNVTIYTYVKVLCIDVCVN